MGSRKGTARGHYHLSYDGVRRNLRRGGAMQSTGFEHIPMDEREFAIAVEFARANADKRWCVSKWRQEFGEAIGRSCHEIPFDQTKEALIAACVRPMKLTADMRTTCARIKS